jgi:hypothetical protein
VKSSEKIKIITVRATAFEKAKEGSNSAKVEKVDASGAIDKGFFYIEIFLTFYLYTK